MSSLPGPRNAFVDVYWGIGDAIYLNPALRVLSTQHPVLYTCSPFPFLFGNIGNLRSINPLNFPEHRPVPLTPMYYDALYSVGHWYDDEYRKETDLVRYKPAGGVYDQPDRNMIEHSLTAVTVDNAELWFPECYTADYYMRLARHFLALHNPEGKPPLLFHIHGRGSDGVLPMRCCPDATMVELHDQLKKDFFLFNVDRWITDYYYVFTQYQLPIFNSLGWNGLCATMALLSLSAGAVFQSSCSIFVLAMLARKPILCANGTCGTRLHHLWSDKMPAAQRQVVSLEPEPYCGCWKDCGKVGKYDVDAAVASFRKLVRA